MQIASLKDLEQKPLKDMKDNDRLPAIVFVDAHNPLFEMCQTFSHCVPHVVSIRNYDEKTGTVWISNQWGEDNDVTAKVGDLYTSMHYNLLPSSNPKYQSARNDLQKAGSVKKDFET